MEIQFCEEIEEFLNDVVSLPWWNDGVSEASLAMYSFLAQHNIPARLGRIKMRKWKDNIHGMLRCIPTMISFSEADEVEVQEEEEVQEEKEVQEEEFEEEELAEEELEDDDETNFAFDDHFYSISSQLIKFEYAQDVALLWELAILSTVKTIGMEAFWNCEYVEL